MKTKYTLSYDLINNYRKSLSRKDFIEFSERRFFNQLESVADEAIRNNVRLIRLAGPSGSGKTTSTKRLMEIIRNKGVPAYYLSMDNWYKTIILDDMPRTTNGDIDYESPDLIDVQGFIDDMDRLLDGEVINLREFDFKNRVNNITDETIYCESNGVVIVEGLHAINPIFNTKHKYMKVYIEPFDVVFDESDSLTSSEIRLCRRMHRDIVDRGMSFEDTIKKCQSVDMGQSKYINPYINDTDIMRVDTLLMYEIFIHKNELPQMESLRSVDNIEISTSIIPDNSILREFYK